ncbi:hypothetical protein OCU04_012715 [Sclerotinia nivalis]|uniref:Uncharacterized protein n=1 Tax=Sclerotinia nivalis TaxID=352851 RepID=A0A9X0DD92_9HELO|nr:hypothetical protein OCU04_012715 [Sclerotinia nivalis]
MGICRPLIYLVSVFEPDCKCTAIIPAAVIRIAIIRKKAGGRVFDATRRRCCGRGFADAAVEARGRQPLRVSGGAFASVSAKGARVA